MATIKDVAERAQVAKSTVSYAFNKPHKVNAETLERILAAAKALNYRPNVFAQGLAGGKTQMIGLLVPDIRYPFNAMIARGIEDRLREEGYIAITASTDGDSDQAIKLMGQLHRRGVSGFIFVSAFYGITAELKKAMITLGSSGVPIVVAGYRADDERIDQVTFRAQAGGREMVSHLFELGHRDIGYIGGRHSQAAAMDRFFGYQEGFFHHGLPLRPELIIETDVKRDQIKAAVAHLLSLPKPPTALFTLSDFVAYAVLDYCQEHGIKIPDDLSLVTFDNKAYLQREIPGITAVLVPVYEVGRTSAELILNRFNTPALPYQHIALPYKFVRRETTASPKQLPVESEAK